MCTYMCPFINVCSIICIYICRERGKDISDIYIYVLHLYVCICTHVNECKYNVYMYMNIYIYTHMCMGGKANSHGRLHARQMCVCGDTELLSGYSR